MALEITGIPSNGLVGIPTTPNNRQMPQMGTAAPTGDTAPMDQQQVVRHIREIEKLSGLFNRRLQYSINRELDQIVVKVIDTETDKVIKVLPPEEIQRLHLRIREAIGLLFDEKI